MSPARAWAWRMAIAAALVATAAWLVQAVEWVEIERPQPITPEMERDATVVARAWLEGLGMKALRAKHLVELPPPQATLVLASGIWVRLDGTPQRLQRWVEQGGHLVVDARSVPFLDEPGWLPIRRAVRRDAAGEDPMAPLLGRDLEKQCRSLTQRPGLSLAWNDDRGFAACLPLVGALAPPQGRLLWALDDAEHGNMVQRVAVGRGRVTAFAGDFAFHRKGASGPRHSFGNRGLLEGNNALLLAALVDARPGAEVWFLTHMDMPALPVWLWQHAWPALLWAAGAVLLWLWQAGARFGPLQAPAPPARHSLVLQVHGLAGFLGQHQPAALHAAALRALHDAAETRLAGWRHLGEPARQAALARLTGQPADIIAAAWRPDPARGPQAFDDALAGLERLRRILIHTRRP